MHLTPLKHVKCSYAVALPLTTMHEEKEGGDQGGLPGAGG